MNWLVIYTKPNFEICVTEKLNRIGIKAYCPTYKKIVQYSDRKKKIERPLLPSYVLVFISENYRNKVFSVPGVIRYVFWLGKPAIVRQNEIENLKKSLSGVIKKFSIQNIKTGMLYTISDGPFRGREGTVLSNDKHKLKLELTGLGIMVILTLV